MEYRMTTAVFDGTTLAVDRQVTAGHQKGQRSKLVYNTRYAYAMVGRIEASVRFWESLLDGKGCGDLGDGCHGILVDRETKQAYTVEGPFGVLLAVGKGETAACGTGADFALMAMHLGKSAKQAVELAMKYDIYTGFGVNTVKP
jgi:hypothetical protein